MNYAIIFAGGNGSRMRSALPKQFMEINNKPILAHTIQIFEDSSLINGIVLVVNGKYIELTKSLIQKYNFKKIIGVAKSGSTAFDSQFNGLNQLKTIANKEDIVLMHDGVRPFIDKSLLEKCINVTKEKGNAITISPTTETVIINNSGIIEKTINRDLCFFARAPQSYHFSALYNLYSQSYENKKQYIDSASMMLDFGKSLNPVVGPVENIKITTQFDYELAIKLFDIFNRY